VTGGIPPDLLAEALSHDAMQAGLGARFLMGMPPRRLKRWTEADIPDELNDRYRVLLEDLLALPLADVCKRKPHVLGLSLPAHRLWVAFYDEWADVQFCAEGEQAAAFAKIEAYAPRLMLLHHVVSHVSAGVADCGSITETSARAGIELARWFAYEACRIYAMLHQSHEETRIRDLVEYIADRGGRVSLRDLRRANSRKWPSKEAAECSLQELVDQKLGHWEETPAPRPGRPHSKMFVLADLPSDKTDKTPWGEEDPDEDESDKTPDTRPWSEDDAGGENNATTNGVAPSDKTPPTGPGVLSVLSDDKSGIAAERGPSGPGAVTGVLSDRVSDTVSAAEDADPGAAAASPGVENEQAPAYSLLTDRAELAAVAWAIEESAVVCLDIETTGLDPGQDCVRLLQLGTARGLWLIDCFRVDPSPLWEVLGEQDRIILGANLMFDLPFLFRRHGFRHQGELLDVIILSRLLTAGGPDRHANALEDLAQRHLGVALDKTYQKGNHWTGTLTPAHLSYAAQDVTILPQLLGKLQEELQAANLGEAAGIEMDALPAWVWLECSGTPVDRQVWQQQTEQAEETLAAAIEAVNDLAPHRESDLEGGCSWNWNKNDHVKEALAQLGYHPKATEDEDLARIDHPFAQAVRAYRSAAHPVRNYGRKQMRWIAEDERFYAGWNPLGNDAGRSSCTKPNLQGVGKDASLRRRFAAPPGRVLVKADWSQLHLRIVASMTGERVMLEAYRRGEDLHTIMAQKITGREEVTRAERQLAKAVNFGLLYGMSAPGLRGYARASYGVEMTPEEAEHARNAFFQLYPAIKDWHRQTDRKRAPETRSLCGRRRLLDGRAWLGHRLSSPVLGTEADALKRALATLWREREQMPGAFPVLVVHDEIVLECDADQAEAAAAWLKQAMLDAMAPLIDPVPVAVETTIARTWGGD
jgi:DNA polymerase-1